MSTDSERKVSDKDRKCPICQRIATPDREYCTFHSKAYSEIIGKYPSWREAFESLSWERYLESIANLRDTGEWARKVAAHELEKISIKRKS